MTRRRLVSLARSVGRRGMTLVEVLVAVVVLGIAATGIAGMSFWAGRSSAQSQLAAARQVVLDAAVAQVGALPFSDLPSAAGCAEGAEEGFAFLLCVRVNVEAEALYRVTVRVTPESELVAADSVVLERSRGVPASPF